jgi:hypothetical protein
MVTRGDISLDVEDFRGPLDWPSVEDLTMDMLQSSVHLPLVPQTVLWPDGNPYPVENAELERRGPEVVRVLNIVVPESRILASRERCPFLVHMEVAATNLEASDARLYAAGVQNLGTTVEEALGMGAAAGAASAASRRHSVAPPSYEIPETLLRNQGRLAVAEGQDAEVSHSSPGRLPPRGGWQADEVFAGDGYVYNNVYDTLLQQEYEELHMQMHSEQPPQGLQDRVAYVTTDSER